eukprot:ANDGO_05318.mRNA.1 Vacuolar protein 8
MNESGGSSSSALRPTGSVASQTVSYRDICKVLCTSTDAAFRSGPRICDLLTRFADQNEEPTTSPNFASQSSRDDVTVLQPCFANPILSLASARSLKILMRKPINRPLLPTSLVVSVSDVLKTHAQEPEFVIEIANSVLNMCYDTGNISAVVLTAIPQILIDTLAVFRHEDASDATAKGVLLSCAGAIQSLCFTSEGKRCVAVLGGIPVLSTLLWHPDAVVRARVVGAIHNLSADFDVCPQIDACGAVSPLVVCLRNPSLVIAGPAAGCLQNMSRMESVRIALKEQNAVEPLSELLFCNEITVQVFAVGALFNILGPDTEKSSDEYRALKRLLSTCMSSAIIFHTLWEDSNSQDGDEKASEQLSSLALTQSPQVRRISQDSAVSPE